MSAAGRQDDLAQEWILQVETHSLRDLEDPGEGWISIDRKLAAALTKIAHGEVGREIIQFSTVALNTNVIARGRVLLAMVFRCYASGDSAQVLYVLNHLQKLIVKGDGLESFHNTWSLVVSELSEPPDPKLLQYLYYEQINNFAGNAIELRGRNGRVLALSQRAYDSLRDEQRDVISRSCTLLPLDVPTIELAGGSVRCMITGSHLDRRPVAAPLQKSA